MLKARILALSLISLPSLVCAQQTIIVDWMLGPGAQYRDIPQAVAAAAHGDRILCRLGAYTAPTTAKGVTIEGSGSILMRSLVVQGLPAGRTFRMFDFQVQRGDLLRATLDSNQGAVYLEDLRAVEHGSGPWSGAAVTIRNCRMVSLHHCETFGSPAVLVDSSTVSMTECRMGRVGSGGLGGGQPLVISGGSVVAIQHPIFDGSNASTPAIGMTNSRLVLTGAAASYVQGGTVGGDQPAIQAQGGIIEMDPGVRLNPNSTAAGIVGSAALVRRPIPVLLVEPMVAGASLRIQVDGRAGARVFLAVGPPPQSGFTSVPGLGDLWLDPAQIFIVIASTLDPQGQISLSPLVPASIPGGTTIGFQAITDISGATSLSLPTVVISR